MASADYKVVGKNYSGFRQPDPRIAALINSELDDMASIINIGAGTGSYEPEGKIISAVEPSKTMLDQRPNKPNTFIYQAAAENLPFESNSHDAALAILTIHHWDDWRKGLTEALRVARKKVVLLTWVGMPNGFWLFDYLPELRDIDRNLFPSVEDISSVLGKVHVSKVPIPSDCTDGFLCAYWSRPEMYLDSKARSAISSFSRISDISNGLGKLEVDIKTGAWEKKYGHLRSFDEYDFGYRLVVCSKEENK